MKYDPARHHRRSIRLKGYDYRQPGAYFITIVTQDRECLFGDVVDGEMRLNDAGRMVAAVWNTLPKRFPTVELDAFIVMPNHIHGIIMITTPTVGPVGAGLVPAHSEPVGAGLVPAHSGATVGAGLVPAHSEPVGAGLVPAHSGATTNATTRATTRVAPTVGDVVGAFKSIVTVEYIQGVKTSGWPPFRGRIWQRNYYEHIIRDEESLHRIREYIVNNPMQWELNRENPKGQPGGSLQPAPTQG